MTKRQTPNGFDPETKPKRDRVYLDILPEDRLKLLALQAKRSVGKRKKVPFGDLAHDTWFNKLPDPPRNFRKNHARRLAGTRKEPAADLATRGVFATPLDKY